jgi:hypothetical protein
MAPELSEGNELLRVRKDVDVQDLRQSQHVIEVIEGAESGDHLLIVKSAATDSLPSELQGLEAKGRVEQVQASEVRIDPKEIGPGDIPKSDPPSGLDLPDIFDIFTRVY